MRRVCFTLRVDPARLAEYRDRHARVWPEMLRAPAAAGWHDYSLFLRDDGLLVGVLRTDGRPDRGMGVLDEVFDLDAQLAAAGRDGPARIGDTR